MQQTVKRFINNEDISSSLPAFLWHFLRAYKYWAFAFVTCAMISGLWGPFNSILLKTIINAVAANENNHMLAQVVFWPSILLLINMQVHDLCWRAMDFINYKVETEIKSDIIQTTFAYVFKQSYQYFQDTFGGKIAGNLNILANSAEQAINQLSMHIIRGMVLLLTAIITMYFVNPMFCAGLLVWTVLFCLVSYNFSRRIIGLANDYAAKESEISGVVVDAISNSQNVRMFVRDEYELSHLDKYLHEMRQSFKRKAGYTLRYNFSQGLSLTALIGYMLYMLVTLKVDNKVTVGDFSLILALTMDVGWTLWWVLEQIDQLNDAIGRCKQSLNKLYMPHEIQDKPNAKDLKVNNGTIVFDNVHFSYRDSEPLFENKSVVIPAGQKVGLVGYSGGGKTTFVNLIMRLYDVESGSIIIDQQNIHDVTQDSLHSAIGMIPQDPLLFHRTLMENIRYGKIDATDAAVIDAAKRAHAHKFIEQLNDGYQSLVGERGIKLSGGQRQRIAIARAILKNAPILILDEATSQLDSVTEHDIQESLWELMQNKTTIIIAHRLSTLLHMDRILVFAQGKIVEDGTHKELLAKGGVYETLWDAQVGGFIVDP